MTTMLVISYIIALSTCGILWYSNRQLRKQLAYQNDPAFHAGIAWGREHHGPVMGPTHTLGQLPVHASAAFKAGAKVGFWQERMKLYEVQRHARLAEQARWHREHGDIAMS